MATITMRTLSRETARVVDEVVASGDAVSVSRDGVEILWLVPMSPVEQRFRAKLRAQGIDPDMPPQPRYDLELLPPNPPGEKSAFDYLMADRDSYYDEN